MSDEYKDEPETSEPKKLSEEQLKKIISDHQKYWQDGLKINFWREVSERNIRDTSNCESIEEIFARYRIVPKFKTLNDLMKYRTEDIASRVGSVRDFLKSTTEKAGSYKANKASRTIFIESFKTIDSSARSKTFGKDNTLKVQNIFKGLQATERNDWSERTYDNVLYSAIFQRYFMDDYSMLGDQKVNEYLPRRVANEIAPDLVLLAEDSPFLICEYGQDPHASNHKDLLKLIETMQRALTKRYERYVTSTNEIYGVLCGGEKLAFFFMEHDRKAGNFPCYFIADSANDLQTTTLQIANIGTILAMNVIIFLGAESQRIGKARRGPEKLTSVVTPSKIHTSAILSVKQTDKKSKSKSKSQDTSSGETVPRCLADDFEELKLDSASKTDSKNSTTTKSSEKSNSGQCAPSTSSSENKNNDPSDDDKSSGTKKNQQRGANNHNKTTTTATNPNTNNTKAKPNQKEASEKVKEKRKALLAQVTQCNALLHDKYRIAEKITDVVHRVRCDGRSYVAKFLFKKDLGCGEEDILSQLSENFIKPIDSFDVGDGLLRCLIFPFLESQPWKTQHEFRRSAYEVIAAISELHERNIMHGDIKYSNIIRHAQKTSLIDFDLAKKDPETYRTKFYGTFGYRAPESMKNGALSLKGDIYSYGILLYELVHQKKMYKLAGVEDDDEEEKVVYKLNESIKNMSCNSNRNGALFAIINRCLVPDPDARPTAQELILREGARR